MKHQEKEELKNIFKELKNGEKEARDVYIGSADMTINDIH